MRQVTLTLLSLVVLLCASAPRILFGAEPADAAALKAILGSESAAWTITGSQHSLVSEQGVPAFTTDGSVVLAGKTS